MSPSKSKTKSSSKTVKELQKASSKSSSIPGNPGNPIQASAYNPVSGTFHTLETVPSASSPHNGRFRTIDETDEHSGSSLGTGAEYDSVSNNDSCSGESEDQKEKASITHRPEAVPGSDNDKREKIRQKNERKHQRQKERRAQELHERCSGYLMSRKLEALAQQLVAMGFSSERATMALILNEGRVEESVAWLFEGGEAAAQQKDPSLQTGGNLKIDITEELARITEMETRYKCTKQEVERAVVACEGDLEKASETLRIQKQENAIPLPKPDGTGDPLVAVGGKPAVSSAHSPMRTLVKSVASVIIQPRRDERDFNYAKTPPLQVPPESGNRNLQALRRIQPKSEWANPQVVGMPVDKRWPSVSSSPSVSYSLTSPLHISPPQAKPEARYVAAGSEGKSLPTGAVREPVIMMHRPQSLNAKQNLATSLSAAAPVTTGWYANGVSGGEIVKTNRGVMHMPSVNLTSGNLSSQQLYNHQHYKPFIPNSVDSAAAGWGGSWSPSMTSSSSSSSSSLTLPPSLGLFTGWGSTATSGSSSPVDWSTGGSMPHCDYNSIDWSLESTTSSRQSDLWMGLNSYVKGSQMCDGWSVTAATSNGQRLGVNGACMVGLQEDGVVPDASSSSAGSHEWTSPFAGRDIFSLPRQFVTSPSQ